MGRRKKLLVGKYQISDRRAQQESPGIEVKLGWDISSNESVTVRAFDLAKFDDEEGVRELIIFEVNTLWRLGHPNVVRLVDVFTSPARNKTFVVVEAVSGGGDLFEAITAKGRLEDDLARHYFTQLLDAAEHCHARGVCHRDIKPENVLLDARGNVKLTGFALAGLFDPSLGGNHVENLLHATCGTPDYTAPEVIQGFAYEGAAADVWSLGVTLYAMLAGYLPFEAESLPAVFNKAQAGDFMVAPGMSVEVRSLLDGMLEPDPESRYTMQDVRAHPWLVVRTHEHERRPHYNHQRRHHHRRQEEEISLRWNEVQPPLGGSPAGLRGRHAPARDGDFKGTCRGGNDSDRGGGVQGWSLHSFVRRQQLQQRQQQQLQLQGGAELGPTDGQKEKDWCEQQRNSPSDIKQGSGTSESTSSGGQCVSSTSSTSGTPTSFRREGDSPFHDCPSPSECEEERGDGERARRRAGLKSYADDFAVRSSVPVSAAGGICSGINTRPAATAAVRGPKATSGMISVARRLGETRLVLSLRLPDNEAATAAGPDRETDAGDGDTDRLVPAKTLQAALESLGCVCRLLPLPTKKWSDEHKTPLVKVKVKACRAIAADGGRGGGERGAGGDEADCMVGVLFTSALPAEATAPPGVASALRGADSTDAPHSSSDGATRNDTDHGGGGGDDDGGGGGVTRNHRPETTEFLAVLSTGTVVAFNALVDDLLALPSSPPCLGSGLSCSNGAEERRERRQSRSRRGRALGASGGGMGGRQCASGVERQQADVTTTTTAAGS